MSDTPTVELIEYLRIVARYVNRPLGQYDATILNRAADRLAELEILVGVLTFEVKGHQADAIAIDALRPPCPTCGGTTLIGDGYNASSRCPGCVDGKVSIEHLAALWNTVHSFADGSSDFACTAAELRRRLRGVKP